MPTVHRKFLNVFNDARAMAPQCQINERLTIRQLQELNVTEINSYVLMSVLDNKKFNIELKERKNNYMMLQTIVDI